MRLSLLALLLAVAVAVPSAGAAGGKRRTLTVFSVATGVQYINTADDRARGHTNNPLDDAAQKLAPKSSGTGDGPFAGDVAVYAVNLFGDPALKKAAGTGVYTCYFNYDQRALCKAFYQLKTGGTLVASGPVDFKQTGFTIVVTGGTRAYLGVRGEVRVAAAPSGAQKLDFEMIE